jgi:hypothetical protein
LEQCSSLGIDVVEASITEPVGNDVPDFADVLGRYLHGHDTVADIHRRLPGVPSARQ